MSSTQYKYFFVEDGFLVVRNIVGYSVTPTIKPVFDKPIAIYNYVTADTYLLGEEKRRLFGKLPDRQALQKILDENKLQQKRKIEIKADESELYLELTEGCNFACAGCATSCNVIKPDRARTLSEQQIKLVLTSFVRSSIEKGYRSCRIKWAGGEPLLPYAYPKLKTGILFVETKLKKQFSDIEIKHTILTNGVYLTKDKVSFFSQFANNLTLSISLWGYDKYQDLLRHPAQGQENSYQLITNNLRYLHDFNLNFNINHVIAPGNMRGFAEFLRRFWDTKYSKFVGKNWPRSTYIPLGFYLYRPPLVKNINMKQYYLSFLPYLRQGFALILKLIKSNQAVQPLSSFDYLRISGSTLRTCGSGLNYVAVGPDGVSDCHEGLYQMKNNFEKIESGVNLFDLAISSMTHTPFVTRDKIKFHSKKADILRFHGGQGCPRVTMEEFGGQVNQASAVEYLYAEIFDELLSLEIMKVLR